MKEKSDRSDALVFAMEFGEVRSKDTREKMTVASSTTRENPNQFDRVIVVLVYQALTCERISKSDQRRPAATAGYIAQPLVLLDDAASGCKAVTGPFSLAIWSILDVGSMDRRFLCMAVLGRAFLGKNVVLRLGWLVHQLDQI